MKKEEFETLVNEAMQTLPEYFLEKLKNVAIVIEDLPNELQLNHVGCNSPYSLLGLYEGVPQTQRGSYNRAMPDKISLFQKNIEAISNNEPEIMKRVIRDTLWHEIGHHFGMNEQEVQNFIKRKFHH